MTEVSAISGTIPAATAIVFRRAAEGPPEILMVQRARAMRFAGGATVFPGGRVDPSDYELAADLGSGLDHEDAAARIAAVRETLEETGLVVGVPEAVEADDAADARAHLLAQGALAPVLARRGWSLDLKRLVPFARWSPGVPGSFDTWFYLADLGTGAVNLEVDATENTRLFWSTARATLARADAGEIDIIFPTRRNLERLAQFGTFKAACIQAEAIPVMQIVPKTQMRGGEAWLTIPEDAGYPVTAERLATARRGGLGPGLGPQIA